MPLRHVYEISIYSEIEIGSAPSSDTL